MAAPGSTHYGYYIISYEFVYVGNNHVRNILVIIALFSILGACVTFVTSTMLVVALRKVSFKRSEISLFGTNKLSILRKIFLLTKNVHWIKSNFVQNSEDPLGSS